MNKGMSWLQKAILTGIVFVLIAWFIQNGISTRPIIGYKLEECPKSIELSYYEDKKQQSVGLGISNSGSTDSSVFLHFKGENIEIANETKKAYNTINGTDVYVNFVASKGSQYYFGERVYFIISKTIEKFSYQYEVIKKSDTSISGIINTIFGEVKGFYPTICKYQKQTDSRFILIE